MINEPYVKKFDKETGECINPITSEKPYVHLFANKRQRNQKLRRGEGRMLEGIQIVWRKFIDKKLGTWESLKKIKQINHFS